jgi:hypothetical protein
VPDGVRLRQDEWNAAVERVLVETLGGAEAEPNVRSEELVASV